MEQRTEAARQIKALALEIGFHKAGFAAVEKLPHSDFLLQWLKAGRHGEMHWMERYLDLRLDIRRLYPAVRSVLVVAHNYYYDPPPPDKKGWGKISRYARGRDYHKVMKKKLKKLLRLIQERVDSRIAGRFFVDSAPVQEKLWAQAAGIGWQGKNTNIITREYGSWIFLGVLLLNRSFPADQPAQDYCGNCTACIEACPTQALQPYQLDASRCISYLTIELWDQPIPQELAPRLEKWIFGCDICQEVCPWNRFARLSDEPAYQPLPATLNTAREELLSLTPQQFKKRYAKTPITRARYENFIRNVKSALRD